MNKMYRVLLLMTIDIILVNIGLYSALLIRFDGNVPLEFIDSFYNLAPIFTVSYLICFYFFELYKRMWKYASINDFITIMSAVAVSTAVNISLVYLYI